MAKFSASEYQVNGVQLGRTRVKIGDYNMKEGADNTIGSLAGYSFFEVVSNRSGNQISSGLLSCADGTHFSFFYPNIMACRGYKKSDTVIHIDDFDASAQVTIYGIK